MENPNRDQIIINAPIGRVFDVITDYERYPDFVPENQSVQVVERQKSRAKVRFEIELLMRVDYLLEIEERPPDHVRWRLLEAKMLTVNSGEWRLEALDEATTRAHYSVEFELARAIPNAVRERLTYQALPKTLQRFKERVETLRESRRRA